MFIKSQVELKQAVTSLRRELKSLYGENTPSHAQCLELMAKALGKSGYAEMLLGLPLEPNSAAKPADAPVAPAVPRYPLANNVGLFDLVERGTEGKVVDGIRFSSIEGPVEDIFYCVAAASCAIRGPSNGLIPSYEGDTDVNWEGQRQRKDSFGNALWEAIQGGAVSELQCLLVPEDFVTADDEDTAYDLPNREALLSAYLDYAKQLNLFGKLQSELPTAKLGSETLQEMAKVIGFSLHLGEWVSLTSLVRGQV